MAQRARWLRIEIEVLHPVARHLHTRDLWRARGKLESLLSKALVALASQVMSVYQLIRGKVPTEVSAGVLRSPTRETRIQEGCEERDEAISPLAFDTPVIGAESSIAMRLQELSASVEGPVFNMDAREAEHCEPFEKFWNAAPHRPRLSGVVSERGCHSNVSSRERSAL